MDTNVGTLIKRYETSADTFVKKGKKYYAYAKNGRGDEYFGKAKYAYKKAAENRQKAQQLKATCNGGGPTIKPEGFLGNINGPMIGPGMAAAGV